jgi:hypothetical protein
VNFVAHPELAPSQHETILARPDDPSDQSGKSWRDCIEEYNAAPGQNRFGLSPAYRLYSPRPPWDAVYVQLVEKFEQENVFVFSAGWGLIPSDYLTPRYDITFTNQADPYKVRKPSDRYNDFCKLKVDTGEDVVLFAPKGYIQLFNALTGTSSSRRFVFFHGHAPSTAKGCRLVPYSSGDNRTWHYSCATDFVAGRIGIGPAL